MDLKYILFSFNGRIPRLHYWIFFVIFAAILYIPLNVIFKNNPEAAGNYELIFITVAIWPSLAVQAKRWHDRNKSAWWILINIIPIVNIWALVENAFLPGNIGRNDYGDDPYAYLDDEETNPNNSSNLSGAENAPPS